MVTCSVGFGILFGLELFVFVVCCFELSWLLSFDLLNMEIL